MYFLHGAIDDVEFIFEVRDCSSQGVHDVQNDHSLRVRIVTDFKRTLDRVSVLPKNYETENIDIYDTITCNYRYIIAPDVNLCCCGTGWTIK